MLKLVWTLPLLALAACNTTVDKTDSLGTGAMLSVDYFGDTDVVGFHFELERVDCGDAVAFEPWSESFNVDLVDGIFPGMVEIVAQTLDPESRHLGSDLFITLDPGCYDITATPASDWGTEGIEDGDSFTPSEDCATASYAGAEVTDGATTEITLISQCVGDGVGATDTLVLINHPPTLSVKIDEKFSYECEAVEVCVTAYDIDDDPIEFVWECDADFSPFSSSLSDAEIIGFEDGHRIWQQCATIANRWTATYDWTVTVYDLGYEAGAQVRMEDLVSPEESHVSLTFPIHTNWIEDPMCIDETGTAVEAEGTEIERVSGCGYTTPEQFYCNAANTYAVDQDVRDHLCDGTDLIEENLYPDCPAA